MFVRDLVAFLAHRMPAGRLVSNAFFDKLASLKLPPDSLLPRFVCACVKSNAACPEDKCRNNVGCHIRESDIKSIATSKLALAKEERASMLRST